MEFSYRDKHYICNALKIYINQLSHYNEYDNEITEDIFSDIQDDIALMSNLLYQVEEDLQQPMKETPERAKLYLIK
ncbi:hypothetical protein MNBD_GAMMA09-1295 [hydrothermal vent metagenome]|uniref:Uncharacterized protein n=1 Tax=hydrothermal vent metagenome TaxID=652676 RepID=A0A3B0X770_9ZZZZ